MPPVTDPVVETEIAVWQQHESSFTRSMHELSEALKQLALTQPSVDLPLSTPKDQNSGPRVVIHLIRHAEVGFHPITKNLLGENPT
jgi:hypothetical protein